MPPRRESARTRRLRKGVAETEFVDLVPGTFPLLGEFEPNPGRAQAWIPREIYNGEDAKRLVHRFYFGKQRAKAVQNLCLTGFT